MKSVKEIAKQIKKELGGNAMDICSGNCDLFAKKLIQAVGKGEIIATKSFDMFGYVEETEVSISEYKGKDNNYPHVFAKIDGKYYDAFNTSGVKYESQMRFRRFKLDKFGFIVKNK